MKRKSIISAGTGNGIFLRKPLEENQKTAAREGQGWGSLMEFMKQYHIVWPLKGKPYISGCFLKEYLIL